MQASPNTPNEAHDQTPLLNTEDGNQPSYQAASAVRSDQGQKDISADPNWTDSKELTTRQLLKTMGGVYLGAFLMALDSTMVATLSVPISTSLNSMSLLSWLASAYLIANAASQPLAGKLTDIFGRRAGLIFCNLTFAAGNLICALANSEAIMILGRVVAGLGGGGIGTIATFVISDLVPLRRRGVWQGIANICFGLGSGLGGIFGGWMNDMFSWRWAFIVQVPLTFLAAVAVFLTVHIPVKDSDSFVTKLKRIDILGAVSLLAALVLMLLGLNSGGNTVPWKHPLVLITLPLSAAFLLIFIYVENRVKEPIIPVKLLLERTVLSACLTSWFTTMARFGLLFYGPIYFQVQGYSATQVGVRFLPESFGVSVASLGSGILMRWSGKYYVLNISTQVIFLCSFGLISALKLSTPSWLPFLYLLLTGIGYGAMLTVTLVALISAVPQDYQAVITSASYAFRSTGSTIGITVASAVFQNVLLQKLTAGLSHKEGSANIIERVRDDLTTIGRLPPTTKHIVMQAYMDALRGVFLTLFGIAVLGLIVSSFIRENRLHNNLSRRSSASE